MPYSIVITRSADKDLYKLPRYVSARIYSKLLQLRDDPKPISSIKLRNRDGYRIRVGDYRALYEIDEERKEVIVTAVGHRKDVY